MNNQQLASTFVERVRFDAKGLVPAIAQDRESGEVLMMAWMNRESLEQTIATGQATYFSRSRHELWVKGATSGNTQRVHSLALDCDGDALILQVDQIGSACHSGLRSCFLTISLDLA
ncbi:MAG: hypothetical protein RJB01_776 [Actinomycetota bacterium]|jgi:phosphoribosyl-AMP cyclohydrolase